MSDETDLERAERVLDAAIARQERDAETIRRLRRANVALVMALRPFAAAADDVDDLDDDVKDHYDIWQMPVATSISAGDLRAARAALKLAKEAEADG